MKSDLIDDKSVADLCDRHGIQPTQFYQWQKQLFENGGIAFERQAKPGAKSPQDRQIEHLQAKLINKNEVIAELMEENVKAKKPMENSERTMGSPGRARRNRRLRSPLERADGAASQAIGAVDRHQFEQVS